MKTMKWILCAALLVAGLGMAAEPETNAVDLTALAMQAAGMNKAELEAMVAKYKTMISGKMEEIHALKTQLKEIPFKEMMGEKARDLKGQLVEKMTALTQLKDTLAVYTNALKTAE